MTKSELTNKIKNYIKEHKDLQSNKVSAVEMDIACKKLKCDMFSIMSVLRFGVIL